MWESDRHISTVHRQNKSLELRGKQLSLEISHVSFSLLDACLFQSLNVKQCRVEETLTKPCFVLIGLVMFFNIANLDTK